MVASSYKLSFYLNQISEQKKRVAFSPFFSFASSAKATSTVVYTVGKAAAEAGVHFAGRGTKSCHGVVASVSVTWRCWLPRAGYLTGSYG